MGECDLPADRDVVAAEVERLNSRTLSRLTQDSEYRAVLGHLLARPAVDA